MREVCQIHLEETGEAIKAVDVLQLEHKGKPVPVCLECFKGEMESRQNDRYWGRVHEYSVMG